MKRLINKTLFVRVFCAAILFAMAVSLIGCGSASGADRELPNASDKIENGGMTSDAPGSSEKINGNEDAYKRKVIRNATVRAETQNYSEALDALTAKVKEFDGYVQTSRISGNSLNDDTDGNNLRVADLTVCIPADKLDEFLNCVGGTINVTYSHITERDVTAEYYDLQSRIDTLNAEKDRLTEMLEDANSVSEMLEIEKCLYDIIEEYEAKQTMLNVYATNIAYSEVNISLSEVRSLTTEDQSFGERVTSAAAMSWRNFGQGFLNFLVWFVSAIPTILLIAVVVGTVLTIVLSSNRRMRKKQEAAMRERRDEQNRVKNDPENRPSAGNT